MRKPEEWMIEVSRLAADDSDLEGLRKLVEAIQADAARSAFDDFEAGREAWERCDEE